MSVPSPRGHWGGKILGAGGGGYFLFYIPKEKQEVVTRSLADLGLLRLGFRFEQKGSQIIEGQSIEPFIERQSPQAMDRNALIGVNSLC